MNNQGGSNSRANIHENYFNEYFNGNFITTCPVKGNVNKCKGKWRTTITIYTLTEANEGLHSEVYSKNHPQNHSKQPPPNHNNFI